MPKRGPAGSVSEQALITWLRAHPDAHGAEVARARLEYQELEGNIRFIRGLLGKTRIRPRVLVTAQVSGRWSTANPPLANRPKYLKKPERDIIVPDYGTWWLRFDWISQESVLAAEYAGERRILDPFRAGQDVYLAVLRRMYPDKDIPEDKELPERQSAKVTHLNLQYAYDHRGILEAPDLGIFGGRDPALAFALRYTESLPDLWAAKRRVFDDAERTGIVRTAFGRLRRLTGDGKTKGKDAWSHTIQGTAAGMMNRVLVQILERWDAARIIVNEHDGATIAFPVDHPRTETLGAARGIVEQAWTLWGRRIACPAEFAVIECPEYGEDQQATQDVARGSGKGRAIPST